MGAEVIGFGPEMIVGVEEFGEGARGDSKGGGGWGHVETLTANAGGRRDERSGRKELDELRRARELVQLRAEAPGGDPKLLAEDERALAHAQHDLVVATVVISDLLELVEPGRVDAWRHA